MNTLKISMLLVVFSMLTACTNKKPGSAYSDILEREDESSEKLLAINASQHGVAYPETFILMQNRKGVRIEYCVDRSNLQLWISPQAGKSFSYVDRNWSNRDDHTTIFDRILIPGLNLPAFDSCNWDPFHSIIYFKDQTLHIAQVYDQPMVMVWFEKEGMVDFKIFGEAVERTPHEFTVNYSDRGRYFQATAVISGNQSWFQHQLVLDKTRSTYTRAHLAPGEYLIIASELPSENIASLARETAQQSKAAILERNEKLIARDLSRGQFKLKQHAEMQKLLNISRRVALSMQDFDGFMRSTNQYIYYLMWYRDGGMNASHLSYSGWLRPAFDQARFSLQNPNISTTDPSGKFFGQVMGGPITKWEEDGLFYVLWPAFSYWSQTGDDVFQREGYLNNAKEAMKWLEDYCYDKKQGLFGRYYYCETPLGGSRDNGFDNATGAPTFNFNVFYEDSIITRSYDLYINILNYANYLMLSMMITGEESESYFAKASALEKNIRQFFDYDDVLPSYGELQTAHHNMMTSKPYGLDTWDYVWGLALPPFTPTLPQKYKELRNQVVRDMTTTKGQYFICVYNAMLTSMDPLIHNEDTLMWAMEKLMPESTRPGKYLPMPYSVPELINVEDGNPFHDVRPLVYSIAPWLSAVTNLGLRRLPFGIAVRSTKYLAEINQYEYLNGVFDIVYEGEGAIQEVLLNGEKLEKSLQLPSDRIKDGVNRVAVKMGEVELLSNFLVSSTVRLLSIGEDSYSINAFGKNVLTFQNLNKEISLSDESGNEVEFTIIPMDDLSYLEFTGKGQFLVKYN